MCSRACSRTSTRATRRCAATASSARAAGTATACPSRSPSSRSSGSAPRRRSRPTGSPSSTRAAARRCSPTSRSGTGSPSASASGSISTTPIARWTTTYIESVWWALRQIHDKGLLYEGHKVVPYCPRCGTALSSHEVALGYREVEDPSVYVRLPVRPRATTTPKPRRCSRATSCWCGRRRRGRWSPTRRWRSTPSSSTSARETPGRTGVRARRRAGRARCSATEAEVLDRFPGRALEGVAYVAPFDFIPAAAYGDRGHTVLLGDFVTAEDGTGLVHTAIAFGEDDFRLGAQYGLTVINPVRLDGTYDERIGPLRRALRQGRRRRADRGPAQRATACCAPPRATTPTRIAGAAARRCCTTPSRPGTSPRRSCATGCWPPTKPSTGIRSTSSTAASATG